MADDGCYDVTPLATVSVSSAARDTPASNLVDESLDTYWQSDDLYTHFINFDFPRRVHLCRMSMYVDFYKDENYTPEEISIHAGNTLSDLQVSRFASTCKCV